MTSREEARRVTSSSVGLTDRRFLGRRGRPQGLVSFETLLSSLHTTSPTVLEDACRQGWCLDQYRG